MQTYTDSLNQIKTNRLFNEFLNITMTDYVNTIEYQKFVIFKNIKKNSFCIEIIDKCEIQKSLEVIAISSLKLGHSLMNISQESFIETNCLLFESKNKDYGNSFMDFGIIGIIIRLNDKLNRILNLLNNPIHKKSAVDEKIEDTIQDLYNYCIIGLMYK